MTEKSIFKKGRKKKVIEKMGKWERLVEENLAFEESKRIDRIYASSAGLCERQTAGQYFLDPSIKEKRKASTEFYFKIGSVFEDIMLRAFQSAGIFLDRETRVEAYHKELPVSGRIDFTVKDPEDLSDIILVELKSCGKLPERPKPSHKAQLMTYLGITGMPRGIIWYISRSVAGWGGELLQKAFEIEPTDDEVEQVIRKVAIGALSAKAKILPPLPDDMKRYKCGFCPLIPYCWEDREDIIVGTKEFDMIEYASIIERAKEISEEVMENQDNLAEQYRELMLS